LEEEGESEEDEDGNDDDADADVDEEEEDEEDEEEIPPEEEIVTTTGAFLLLFFTTHSELRDLLPVAYSTTETPSTAGPFRFAPGIATSPRRTLNNATVGNPDTVHHNGVSTHRDKLGNICICQPE
jgi:hypothetical protein